MSFYDIRNKDERDRTIEEYLATMERIKKRNVNDRIAGMQQEADMQEMFESVLESNAEMANEITQDLVPIQKELEAPNETIQKRARLNRLQQQIMSYPRRLREALATPLRPRGTSDPGHIGSISTHYLKKALTEGNDSVTGIRFEGPDNMMIGDKKIEIQDENNLKVDDEIYCVLHS